MRLLRCALNKQHFVKDQQQKITSLELKYFLDDENANNEVDKR